MKSYTDIEQSRKLAGILPLESADMCYIKHSSSDNPNWEFNEDFPPMILGNVHINEITAGTLPCWSLAALLRVIPKHIKDYNVLRIDISDNDFAIWYDEIGYGVNDELPNITKKSAVDACVNMIVKLKEKNVI